MPPKPPVINPLDGSIVSPEVGAVLNVNTPPVVPVITGDPGLLSQ